MKTALRTGSSLLLVAYLIWLGTRNAEPVTLDVPLIGQLHGLSWMMMGGAALVGGLIAAGLLAWPLMRRSLRARQDRRQIEQLQQEIHGLRILPLSDEHAAGDPPKGS